MMQTLSPFLPALTWNPTPPALARGVICRSDREASGDWLQCVTARAALLPLLQTQPLTVVILAWFKGLLHCRQEKRAISSALSSISCWEALLLWVMPELWLTDYGGINKYNLILIKSDKVCQAAREWSRPSPPWYTNRWLNSCLPLNMWRHLLLWSEVFCHRQTSVISLKAEEK